MKRILLILVVLVLSLTQIAAAAPDSTTLAVNIATAVAAIIVPFLPLAHLPFSGKQMVGISMIAALLIAVAANIITGDLTTADFGGSLLHLAVKVGLVWAGMQAVFQFFKDTVPALTTAPIGATPKA